MSPEEFKKRTYAYGIAIVRIVETLPRGDVARELGRQLLRAGMSVGANYRAAARARSGAEFVAKLGIVEEECDESLYWFDALADLEFVKEAQIAPLRREGTQILSMIVASIQTARARPVKRLRAHSPR